MIRSLLTISILVLSLSAADKIGLRDQSLDQARIDILEASPALNVIYTGTSDSSNHHYGMSYYNDALYLTLYRSGQVTKVSLTDYLLTDGFPSASSNFGNHGIEIDETDGSIWTGTANSVLKHHSASLGFIESKTFPFESANVEYQPINLIIHGDELYVADRKKDSIYVLDKTSLAIENSFPISGMDSASAGGYIDMFVYSNKLYVVSDELAGITSMNLDGTDQNIIMVRGYDHLNAFGIYIKDDIVYLNGHSEIIITNLSGRVLDGWDFVGPEGYNDRYLDMEVVDDQIYVASSWDVLHYPSCDTLDRPPCSTVGSHLLVYDVPLNFAPLLSAIEDASTFEDSASEIILLKAYDVEDDALIFSAESDVSEVSIHIVADSLTLIPAPNWHGTAKISVYVSDGTLADTTEFRLTVISVNDPPAAFSLVSPVDQTIVAGPEEALQTFIWDEAEDVDGEQISYQLHFESSTWNFSVEDITTTNYGQNVEEFPRGVDISWSVIAFDNDTNVASLDTNSIQISSMVATHTDLTLPDVYVLEQNYPNPFNPSTTIRYGLPEDSNLSLLIYDVQGHLVQTLESGHHSAGWYDVVWNGQTSDGKTISTGLYFVRLVAGDFSQMTKMLHLK